MVVKFFLKGKMNYFIKLWNFRVMYEMRFEKIGKVFNIIERKMKRYISVEWVWVFFSCL